MSHGEAVWIHPDLVSEAVAARALGIKPTTLRRQIERIGLRPDARSATRRRYWDVRALDQALRDAPDAEDAARAALASVLGTVDRHDDRSLTRQIADDLRAVLLGDRGGLGDRGDLAGEAFGTGGRLPSTTAIARHYRVSDNTVRRALRVLRAEGLLVRRSRAAVATEPGPVR
ncbi:GntR family transcriptional regulator [Pseudonocardia abyssalis]|jgi:hypothetical protein|uniref:GntR family transcriptional regulator n=1 Tax=Pseudonocardia abyssalis TaxID=2792008 RepID=A0ABS6UR26_9PSEU|nr:GntR family transcriptional regulator [Pseudonocardia abyssalis]MBW0115045.1 GntR family transcriptional regulator [Pseudonocardia abyssalis]MBW0134694.1 GntR family transcriptional regulator [Pseudonocardia abyssalis]